MEVVIFDDKQELSRAGADAMVQHVRRNPQAVLGLATGSSPLPIYRELAARVERGELSLAGCKAFLLDEYVGLPPGHPESYRAVIQRELLDRVDIAPENIHVPDGCASDLSTAGPDYERAIAEAGGIDVQLLGVGSDGHIAFNEPGSSLVSRTRLKALTSRTRRDNARFFGGDTEAVPHQCLTQGVGTILEAGHLVLIAHGPSKAQAVRTFIEGPVSAMCPASALQMHPHVTVLLDAAAADDLVLRDYYREAYQIKPDWQEF